MAKGFNPRAQQARQSTGYQFCEAPTTLYKRFAFHDVQTSAFRCGIFSHLAFDDPSKQNLPKNAEWTSIKCAVVICSSPHIHKVSQSNLQTNNLNISMLQYVAILSPSFASYQPAPNVTVRKFKHTHFSRSQSVPVLKTEATAAMCLKDMDLIHLTHIN